MAESFAEPFLADFTDAEGCYGRIAWRLGVALRSTDHPLRLMTLATVGPDRSPHARLVVLRAFDADERSLRFHTDCRSPKVRQISAEPRVSLLLYDPAARLQFRVMATARLHHGDEVTREGWEATPAVERASYAHEHGPGTGLDPGDPVNLPAPPSDEEAAGFDNFVVVVCHFDAIDVVELHPAGFRRVRLEWDADGLQITRLTP